MQAHIITALFDKLLVFSNATTSKTVALWIEYIKMVEICLQFLEAEHTRDWQLHLFMNHRLLSKFASLGHCHHQKLVYLYL